MRLAPYLRTKTAAERGLAADQRPRLAFATRRRGFVRLTIGHRFWTWRLWYVNDPRPGMGQGKTVTGKPQTRRVWINPDLWDWPDALRVAGDRELGIPRVTNDGSMAPMPCVIPFNEAVWKTGEAPAGMHADLGILIDYDETGAKGWELLGLQKPSWLSGLALSWRSKPWIFGSPTFIPGLDWQADAILLRVTGQEWGHGGKVRGGKRRGIVTRGEIEAGVIEHAISVVDFKTNHGLPKGQKLPAGVSPPTFVLPSQRVEHIDRDPCPTNATPAGHIPGVNYPNGTAFALRITDAEIEDIILAQYKAMAGSLDVKTALRTLKIILVALRDYGWEEYETGCGEDPMIETDGPLPGLNEFTAGTILDRILTPENIVVLEPAA